MLGCREAVATCTGERPDSRTAPARQRTETVSRERAPPDISWNSGIPCAHWIQTETGSSGSTRGVAGGVRNTRTETRRPWK